MNLRFGAMIATAAMATVFGFAGATGAIFAFHDTLKGDVGAKGATGSTGAQGPQGVAAPADRAVRSAVVALEEDMAKLEGRVLSLGSRDSECALVTPVVTDVRSDFDGSVTAVKTPMFVCLKAP